MDGEDMPARIASFFAGLGATPARPETPPGFADTDVEDNTGIDMDDDDEYPQALFARISAGRVLSVADMIRVCDYGSADDEDWRNLGSALCACGRASLDALSARDGLAPLHHAARSNHESLIKMLVAKRCDVNVRSRDGGETPLFFAARAVCKHGAGAAAVTALLHASAKTDAQATCAAGRTFIDAAADSEEDASRTMAVLVEALAGAKINRRLSAAQRLQVASPKALCVRAVLQTRDPAAAAEALGKLRANARAAAEAKTPGDAAAADAAEAAAVAALLSPVKRLAYEDPKSLLNAFVDALERAPDASPADAAAIAALLVSAGADVCALEGDTAEHRDKPVRSRNWLPLPLAAVPLRTMRPGWQRRQPNAALVAVARVLLAAGGAPCAGAAARAADGRSPLHWAMCAEAVALIREFGAPADVAADLTVRGSDLEATPLHFAAMNNKVDAARAMIEAGADACARTGVRVQGPHDRHYSAETYTPLAMALGYGVTHDSHTWKDGSIGIEDEADMVTLLAAAGADVNERWGAARMTPLMFVCQVANRGAAVRALVAAGADVLATDANGETALHYTIKRPTDYRGHRMVSVKNKSEDTAEALREALQAAGAADAEA